VVADFVQNSVSIMVVEFGSCNCRVLVVRQKLGEVTMDEGVKFIDGKLNCLSRTQHPNPDLAAQDFIPNIQKNGMAVETYCTVALSNNTTSGLPKPVPCRSLVLNPLM